MMVNSCCAFGCTNRFIKGINLGFFRFPRNQQRRYMWILAVRRQDWTPHENTRLCGQHFQTGRPSQDKNHPDYIPNVFSYKKSKNKKKIRKKKCLPQDSPKKLEVIWLRNEVQQEHNKVGHSKNEKSHLQQKTYDVNPVQQSFYNKKDCSALDDYHDGDYLSSSESTLTAHSESPTYDVNPAQQDPYNEKDCSALDGYHDDNYLSSSGSTLTAHSESPHSSICGEETSDEITTKNILVKNLSDAIINPTTCDTTNIHDTWQEKEENCESKPLENSEKD